mmetsp:Transcript_74246/g.138685  ORF Transcript_74246/g.138685 Transcript_74246/m.138685 type:complete len:191 (+) Transcript_74246:3-575(+)
MVLGAGKATDPTEHSKNDHDMVLEAVKRHRLAPETGSAELRSDRQAVLTEAKRNGWRFLRYASAELKRDREVVLEAVNQDAEALRFAAEELLLDASFAVEAKERCYIIKVSLLSGRYLYWVEPVRSPATANGLIRWCWEQFGLGQSSRSVAALIHGDTIVPGDAYMPDWPGIQPLGQISEYQLVVGAVHP